MTPKQGNSHSKSKHFRRKGCPKDAFLKTLKIENGTQIQFFYNRSALGPSEKTVPRGGLEKHNKTMDFDRKMIVFRSETHATSIVF